MMFAPDWSKILHKINFTGIDPHARQTSDGWQKAWLFGFLLMHIVFIICLTVVTYIRKERNPIDISSDYSP